MAQEIVFPLLDSMKSPNGQKPDSKFAGFRGLLLVAFGVVGFTITCLQGLIPFIELAQWVSWIVSNWTAWSRALWLYVFAYFSIDISKATADLLSGAFYLTSIIIVFRRRHGLIYSNTSWIFKFIKKRKGVSFKILEIALFIPNMIIVFLLYLNSFYLSFSFVGIDFLIAFSVHIVGVKRFMKIDRFLFGEQAIAFSDWTGATFYIVLMSWYVVLFASIVLILNEIGINAANILAFMKLARCNAGITC